MEFIVFRVLFGFAKEYQCNSCCVRVVVRFLLLLLLLGSLSDHR